MKIIFVFVLTHSHIAYKFADNYAVTKCVNPLTVALTVA